jgi:fibronectin type 3 domain-containing protein
MGPPKIHLLDLNKFQPDAESNNQAWQPEDNDKPTTKVHEAVKLAMKTKMTPRSPVQAIITTPVNKSKNRLRCRAIFYFQQAAFIFLLMAAARWAPLGASAAGTWSALSNQAPGGVGLLQLLSDGTVMGQNGSSWYKLTPDGNGHYINGTWSTLASMHDTRTYWQSQVLTDGRLFASGGEYGSGGTNCETYDPLSNTWTQQPQPGINLIDSESETLPNGNVLVAALGTGSPCLVYDIAANTWSDGPVSIDGQDEAAWVKLSDGSTLTIDPFGTNSERFIPSLNQWIADNPVPITMYGYGGELGAGFLLPNGNAFYIGATNHTAIYTPSGGTNAGVWTAGANIPYNSNAGTTLGAVDSSAALMFNGKILCALGTVTNFGSTTYFYEYDYKANTFTQVSSPTGGSSAAIIPYGTQMLDLPDGTVLFSYGNAQVYSYQPDGSPVTNGIPTINNVVVNYDGSYTIFGTLLNGISQGAAYGDDKQMDTGRPIAWLTNSSGNVQFCRMYKWSTCDVATGTNVLSTFMTLPSGLANGTYPLVAAANGISSAPHSLTVSGTVTRPPAPTGLAATGGPNVINLAWIQSTGTGTAYNRIYRSVNGSGGPYTLLATVPATTGYADTSTIAGNTYYYEVSAINATAESAPSGFAGATAQYPPPSGIISIDFVGTGTAMGAGESAGVMLASNWNNATGASGSLSSLQDSGTLVMSASATWSCNNTWSLPITDTPGNYRMMKGYLDGTSTSTTTVTVSNLSSTYTANGYDIYVYCDGDNATYTRTGGYTIGTITIDATDTGGTNFSGTFVQANNSAGNYVVFSNETAASFALSATPVNTRAPVNGIQIVAHASAPPPPAPTGLSATGGNGVVSLTWTQSTGTNVTGNNVYRSTSGSGGPYNLLANVAPATSYPDTAVSSGTTYFYSVTAVNGGGESALSAYAGATTIPAAPTGLTATAGNKQVTLSWTASTGASSYNVKRSTVNNGPYTVIATGVSSLTYTNTGLTNGTTYYYVVSAVNGSGESTNSAQASATPQLGLPPPTGNWHFNDGSGTTATDSSGNGYNGALSGNSGATWVTGFSGTGIQFNGTSNWVTFGTGPSVNGTNNFTVAAWIKTTASAQGVIMQQRDVAGYNGEYQLSVNANGTVQFYLYGGGNYQFNFATTNAVNNGAWHQVVAVRKGLAGNIYIDGALAATATGSAVSSMANTITTAVGRDIRDQNKNFNGTIDEVLEYSTYCFSATDVQTLYNSYF